MPGHARAFGLDVLGDIGTLGLPASASSGARRTEVEIVSEAELDACWPRDGARRLFSLGEDGAPFEQSIDLHPEAGFRLFARGVGTAVVSSSGERILSAAAGPVDRLWRRFLVGRILPLAAVLQGLEIFHASAVSIAGRVFGFVGPSGVGKTSLAARLVLRGATFHTDDVLALEGAGDGVRAHAGAATMAVRPAEYAQLSDPDRRRLGKVVDNEGKSYITIEPPGEPLPVGGLYFLRRTAEGEALSIDGTPPPSATVLGSSFLPSVRTPALLASQLEICARLAREVPLSRIAIPPTVDAAELAERIEEHVASRTAAGV